MLLMFAWTAGLVHFWGPPVVFSVGFFVLAAVTTIKFVVNYSQEADKNSYWWYNVSFHSAARILYAKYVQIWLIAAHTLPLFKRFA